MPIDDLVYQEEQRLQREEAQRQIGERILNKIRMEAQDEISLKNPTSQDFVIRDFGDTRQERWVFPAQTKDIGYGAGKRVVPRYVAKEYSTQMMNILIGRFAEEVIEKEKKTWKGVKEDWAEHQRAIEPRTDNPELIKKFFPLLEWTLVRKFGRDEAPEEKKPTRARHNSVWDDLTTESESKQVEEFAEQVAE